MARVIINSVDSFGDKINQKIIASKSIEEDVTIFKYSNKDGDGEIRVSSTSAEIHKKGEIQSSLFLKEGETTIFSYKTPYFAKNFTVFCKTFNYSENKLTTSYIIYDNNDKINQLDIEIIEVR